MTEQQTEQQTCSYPKCNCAFDMGADNKCLRSLPMKRSDIDSRPCATDAMQRLATENEDLRILLEKAIGARKTAQIQLEEVRAQQRASGLCIDAALRGESRSDETYWDGRLEAVRRLAVERNNAIALADLFEVAVLEEIGNRDHWEERATDLAIAVGEHLGVDVGEHSSANCPVQSAKNALKEAPYFAEAKAAGAAELLQRATKAPGFSGSVVRVDVLQKIISRMEGKPCA